MNNRNFNLSGSRGDLTFNLTGQIVAGSNAAFGSLTLIRPQDFDPPVTTVGVSGAVVPGSPESITLTSDDVPTLDVSLAGSIGTAKGITMLSLTGTDSVSGMAILTTVVGTTHDRLVQYAQPQHAAEESGFTVLEGASADDACAIARKLNAAYLDLIAGQSVTRTEFSGRSVYFQRGDIEALRRELRRYEALCDAQSNPGTASPRRRASINPRPIY